MRKFLCVLVLTASMGVLGCDATNRPGVSAVETPEASPSSSARERTLPPGEGISVPSPGTVQIESVTITPLTLREAPVYDISVRDYAFVPSFKPFGRVVFSQNTFVTPFRDLISIGVSESGVPLFFVEGLDLEARLLTAIRVTLEIPGGKPGRVYWARREDAEGFTASADAGWPYTIDRSVRFLPGNNPKTWVARVEGHALWNGAIDRILVSVSFSGNELSREISQSLAGGAQAAVRLWRIEFLGELWGL